MNQNPHQLQYYDAGYESHAAKLQALSSGDETQNATLMPVSLPSSKLVRFLFVMSLALNHLVMMRCRHGTVRRLLLTAR